MVVHATPSPTHQPPVPMLLGVERPADLQALPALATTPPSGPACQEQELHLLEVNLS